MKILSQTAAENVLFHPYVVGGCNNSRYCLTIFSPEWVLNVSYDRFSQVIIVPLKHSYIYILMRESLMLKIAFLLSPSPLVQPGMENKFLSHSQRLKIYVEINPTIT